MLDHAMRAGVVGGKGQSNVAEASKLRRKVPRGSIQILGGIEGIGDTEEVRGRRHELPETLRAFRRSRSWIETAFLIDQRHEEVGEPGRGETGSARP